MGYDAILKSLYDNYYSGQGFSDVSSSHWKEFGGQEVKYINGNYELSGKGFGNYIRSSIKRNITYFPAIYLSNRLLKEYNPVKEISSAGKKLARLHDRIIEFDCVKQILSLNLIYQEIDFNKLKTVCIIGDGYANMGCLIKMISPETRIISVNLGRTLFFDVYYTRKAFPEFYNDAILINSKEDSGKFPEKSFIFVEAENYNLLLNEKVDLYINIASMQEMDAQVIETYFKIMRSGSYECYFYCCNRVEKVLPDGTIVRFFDYPWSEKDGIIVDELCPWYQRYPASRPPFWREFDGPHHHRLVRLEKE